MPNPFDSKLLVKTFSVIGSAALSTTFTPLTTSIELEDIILSTTTVTTNSTLLITITNPSNVSQIFTWYEQASMRNIRSIWYAPPIRSIAPKDSIITITWPNPDNCTFTLLLKYLERYQIQEMTYA